MKLSRPSPIRSLSLLIPLIPLLACQLPSKVCIGDCGDESGDDTTGGAPDIDSASGDGNTTTAPTTGGGDTSSTTGTDTTGEPVDVCTIPNTFSRSETCSNNVHDAGEFCLGEGYGSPLLAPDVISFVAGHVDAVAGADVFISHADRTVGWTSLTGAGGTWPMAFPADALILTDAADFDGDGNLDVIGRRVGGTGDSVEIAFTDGAGQPLEITSVPLDAISFGPAALDWNDDGHLDMVVITAASNAPVFRVVLQGDGTGAFTVVPQNDFIGPYVGLHAVGALDADVVRNDFMVVEVNNTIGIKSGDEHTVTNIAFGPDAVVHALEIREIDGDGLGDVVALVEDTVGGGTSVVVALQTAEPTVFTVTGFPVRCGATTFALGDLDQDGALDLAAGGAGDDPMVTIRLGDGQGDFSPVMEIELTPADELRIADFFGDGTISIAAANHAYGSLVFAVSTP